MKRLIRVALGAVVLLALAAGPAFASQTRVKELGDAGRCVLLASDATLCPGGIVND